jgi:hypothetical protein
MPSKKTMAKKLFSPTTAAVIVARMPQVIMIRAIRTRAPKRSALAWRRGIV